jgi:pyruvate/2-oxoglutarate dehydrogenase complex dihydrolipoamide acyltransferase (E2) component
MPKLSPSMKSGQIIKWHVKPGQILSEHDLVVDIKANSVEEVTDVEVPEMEVEIIEYMFVAKFLAKEKEILKAGAPIAIMCEKEQDIPLAANLKV